MVIRTDPLLYRVLVLDTDRKVVAFAHTLRTTSKPNSFFATHVKIMVITVTAKLPSRFLIEILSACVGVESLACWYGERENGASDHLAVLNRLSPRKLSVIAEHFGSIPDFSFPVFRNLTHLDLVWSHDHADFKNFGDMVHLTHLSFDLKSLDIDLLSFARSVVLHIPGSLRVCILYHPDVPFFARRPDYELSAGLAEIDLGDIDPRLLLGTMSYISHDSIVCTPPLPLLADWSYRPRGSMDLWEKAEAIVRKRRAVE